MNRFFIAITSLLLVCVSASGQTQTEEDIQEKFDRGIGISTSTFIPKGYVGTGVSVSYNNYQLGNGVDDAGYSILSLISSVHGNMLTFGVAPWVSYFVADNFSIGARFDYSRSSLGLGNAAIALGDIFNMTLSDYHFLKQSYTGAITGRYYVPIANSKRFAMFAELRAIGGYGQSEAYQIEGTEKYGTYQDIYKFELGLVPGITVFVTDWAAVELAVGLMGVDYNKVIQTTNQVDVSVMENSSANFKINPLALSLGLSFYLPTPVSNKPKKQ